LREVEGAFLIWILGEELGGGKLLMEKCVKCRRNYKKGKRDREGQKL
jgi:hypothetical protein